MKIPDQLLVCQNQFFLNIAENIGRWELVNISINIALAQGFSNFFVLRLSNGYSPANLANSSTRQKFAVFGEWEYSPKRPFSEIRETRQTRPIRQAVLRVLARLADIRQTVLRGLARLANIRQAVLRGLARLAKGKFGECYANLGNLASLANLASVG